MPPPDPRPSDISEADHIFVSHGHFDHILDIPDIVAQPDGTVHCCPISTYVDIRPFITGVKRTCPDTQILILKINETMTI